MAKYNLPLTSTEFSSKDYYINIRKSLVSGFFMQVSIRQHTSAYVSIRMDYYINSRKSLVSGFFMQVC
jgi:hypothetical protein